MRHHIPSHIAKLGFEATKRFLKITFGAIVADARGSVSGNTISRNASGAYIRKRVAPTQPRTTKQQLAKSNLVNVSQAWRGLTAAQIISWNQSAAAFVAKNKLGQGLSLTGQQYYMKVNNTLLAYGQTVITAPPVLVAVTNLTSFSLTDVIATPSLKVVFAPAVPAAQVYGVWGSTQLSAGISNPGSKMRYLGNLVNGNTSPFEIYSIWNAVFGSVLVLGQKIFIDLIPIVKATGQKGQRIRASIVIS